MRPRSNHQSHTIPYVEVAPNPATVLKSQGVPARADPGDRVQSLLTEAFEQLEELIAPVGLTRNVTIDEFAAIYPGEGHNAESSPLAEIFPRAKKLVLFAVTLGGRVTKRISSLFDAHDFALASLLDAAASEAADQAAEALERKIYADLIAKAELDPDSVALRYSPGYCGWHVSGQKALFKTLEPEEIGITLRESFLMEPLKSISGVIVAGPTEIHDFATDYPFCFDCADYGCRTRFRIATSRRQQREH